VAVFESLSSGRSVRSSRIGRGRQAKGVLISLLVVVLPRFAIMELERGRPVRIIARGIQNPRTVWLRVVCHLIRLQNPRPEFRASSIHHSFAACFRFVDNDCRHSTKWSKIVNALGGLKARWKSLTTGNNPCLTHNGRCSDSDCAVTKSLTP
jgi:hypothetical protein